MNQGLVILYAIENNIPDIYQGLETIGTQDDVHWEDLAELFVWLE